MWTHGIFFSTPFRFFWEDSIPPPKKRQRMIHFLGVCMCQFGLGWAGTFGDLSSTHRKIHHEWRRISYWKGAFSIAMLGLEYTPPVFYTFNLSCESCGYLTLRSQKRRLLNSFTHGLLVALTPVLWCSSRTSPCRVIQAVTCLSLVTWPFQKVTKSPS